MLGAKESGCARIPFALPAFCDSPRKNAHRLGRADEMLLEA